MNSNPERIEALFEASRHLASRAERAAYLDRACGADLQLRRQVEAMLEAEVAADQYFRTVEAPGEVARETLTALAQEPLQEGAEGPGTVVGRYKLLQQIGEGGFGVVYMAEQREPVLRKVALKVIKLGMDTKQVVARFEAERQALALMDHPHIAKVLDAGATETGRPYFVMELVHGVPITTYCDKNNLSTAQRLGLFLPVCQAIQHAHQKGIIHRDIKPSNVLVTLNDGVAHPMVIDFGVAKALNQRLTEKTLFTDFGQMIGTPAYMSPEQAEMSKLDVDTRSDVYSLGVLLYELLTGTTPFPEQRLRGAGWAEMQRIIAEEEPPRPSTRLSALTEAERTGIAQHRQSDARRLTFLVRGELDWIVMKCLEKDRGRRYETANGLALDVQRYLNDEPVLAVAPSARYRTAKFVRRHRAGLGVAGALMGMLVAGVIVSSWQMVRAREAERLAAGRLVEVEKERGRAEQARGEAEAVSEFLVAAFRSPDPHRDGRTVTVAEVLDRAATNLAGRFEDAPERRAALLESLGETYLDLGLYREAEGPLVESLELRRKQAGPVRTEALGAMQKVSSLYRSQGRFEEAEKLAKESLDVSRQRFGAEHTNTLAAMENLASAYLYSPRLRGAEAEGLLTNVVAALTRRFGPDDPWTLRSALDLAGAYRFGGAEAKAEALYLETLERMRRVHHEQLPRALNNLGSLYLGDRKRSSETERLFREALEIVRRILGPDHPETMVVLQNVANACYDGGKWSEAESLYGQALEILREKAGLEHPKTLTVMANLADVKEKLGRFQEAEQIARDVLPLQRKVFGAEDFRTLRTMSLLGRLQLEQGRLADAEKLTKETSELKQRALGSAHPGTLIEQHNLACVYELQARFAEAEALYLESLEIRRSLSNAPLDAVLQTAGQLGQVMYQQSKADAIELLLRQVLADCRQREPTNQTRVAGAIEELVVSLLEAEKFKEAEPLARECLALREKQDAKDWLTVASRNHLAACLIAQERYAEAEPLLNSAHASLKPRRESLPRGGRSRLAETRFLLARLYEATGRTNEIAALTAANLSELGVPERAAQATLRQVDLSLFFSASLNEDFDGPPGRPGTNNLAALPAGLHELAGTMFDLRGVVQLDHGPTPEASRDCYRRAGPIPIRQRAGRLHFLQACAEGVRPHAHYETEGRRIVVESAARGSLIGRYVVCYADGQRRTVPIRLGREVSEWWHWPESPPPPDGASVAWTGTTAFATESGARVRLFKTTWVNPLPEVAIHSLDYISAMAPPAPFLIAITAE